jgi:hypothetical protein
MGQHRSSSQIEELLRNYRERGNMTREAFCEKYGIGRSTLGYYVRRYNGQRGGLARVEVTPTPPAGFTLVLANGRRIECGGTDLAELIRVAEVA